MSQVYKNWAVFPMSSWRWADFSPQEIACRGTGELMIDETAMDRLQRLRVVLGKPILLNSAYRSAAHNKKVGGAPGSQHLLARAFDCRMDNQNPAAFEAAARKCGFTGFGYYPAQGFMHIDIGPARTWGTPFKKSAPTPSFRPEPARETVPSALLKPEVLTSAGGLLSGAAVVAQGNGPVQYAVAGVLVLAAIIVAVVVAGRVLKNRVAD